MTIEVRLAVDAMGGDYGLSVTVPAVKQSLERHSELKVLLFGPAKELMLKTQHFSDDLLHRIIICNAPDSIAMTDSLDVALTKHSSSMRLAIETVMTGRADALVTAGHTSALIALCDEIIPTCPTVTHPVFFRRIPSASSSTFMLDIGARLEASAKELIEYAFMGHYSARILTGQLYPKIGLLNVGKEDNKGTLTVQAAHQFLKTTSLNYKGFVEGHDVFANAVDVIVCNGLVGNIALKTAESASNALANSMKSRFARLPLPKVFDRTSNALMLAIESLLDPSEYNGALLVGLSKNIVKSHGAANARAFANAISVGLRSTDYYLPDKITQGLKEKKLQLRLNNFSCHSVSPQ